MILLFFHCVMGYSVVEFSRGGGGLQSIGLIDCPFCYVMAGVDVCFISLLFDPFLCSYDFRLA